MGNSRIHFLSVPFTMDGTHQSFNFSNKDTQSDYFYSMRTGVSVVDKAVLNPDGGRESFAMSYADIEKVNYIMFKNPSYGDRWFYAYIVSKEPASEDRIVHIEYALDPMQTYFFEMYNSIRPSYVDREHITHGPDRNYNIDEELPTGKLKSVKIIEDVEDKSLDRGPMKDIKWFIFSTTKNIAREFLQMDLVNSSLPHTINHYAIPFSMKKRKNLFFMDIRYPIITPIELADIFSTNVNLVNSLVSISIKDELPIKGIGLTSMPLQNDGTIITLPKNKAKIIGMKADYEIKWGDTVTEVKWEKFVLDILSVEDSELVKDGVTLAQTNNVYRGLHSDPRLNRPPFTRYYIESSSGAQVEFNPDEVGGPDLKLKYYTNLSGIDSSILSVNEDDIFSDSIDISSTQSLPIINDNLAAFMQSRANSRTSGQLAAGSLALGTAMKMGTAAVGGSGVAGLATALAAPVTTAVVAAPALAAAAAVGATALIASELSYQSQKNAAKNTPNSATNTEDPIFDIINGTYKHKIRVKTVDEKFKNLAEDYFKRYGYKTMEFKQPNIKTRRSYNYIKGEVNFSKNSIPQRHIETIKTIFSNGVTFWHSADVYNYDRSNGER